MDCPACHIPLIVVEREGIEVDWCLECKGLWFDEGELELLGQKAGRKLESEDLGRRDGDEVGPGDRKCPRCRRRMQRLSLGTATGSDVEVDRCDAHGLWLDHGELGRVIGRRKLKRPTDESVMLRFLGETFGGEVPTAASHPEGRQS
jgi:Zn-finger nucleic acid-binding protein